MELSCSQDLVVLDELLHVGHGVFFLVMLNILHYSLQRGFIRDPIFLFVFELLFQNYGLTVFFFGHIVVLEFIQT